MRHLHHFISVFLVFSGVIIPLPSLSNSSFSIANEDLGSVWGWDDWFGDKGRDAGTRTGFCMLFPNRSQAITWSLQPVFAWQGLGTQIRVVNDATGQELWAQTLTPEQRHTSYTGDELQSGQNYYVEISYDPLDENNNPTGTSSETTYYFVVMSEAERQRITAELSEIEAANPGLSDAELQEQRARYFAEQSMGMDAVRELFSNPSEFSIESQERWWQTFCGISG